MCLGVFLLGPNFFGFELPGLGMSSSFTRFGKFTFIIFSNKFSISCSSYPSGTPVIQMLEHLKFWRFLGLSSFSEFLFLHSVLVECLFLLSVPNHWFESQFPSHHSWFPIFLYFTLHSLHFFLYFVTILNHSCERSDYQCFELCIWQVGYLFFQLTVVLVRLLCLFLKHL